MGSDRWTIVVLISIMIIPITAWTSRSQQPSQQTLSELEVVTVSEDEFVITWFTETPSDTKLEYGSNGEMEKTYSNSTPTSYHVVALSGLSSNTTYRYRAGSGLSWSEVDTFTTLKPPLGDYLFTFAMVTDTHYRDDNIPNTPDGRMLEVSDRLSESLVGEIDERDDVEFTIIKGDLTDGGNQEQFSGFGATYDDLRRPMYPLLGNHDKFSSDWEDGWENLTGWNTTYYSFEHSGILFIILDSAQDPYRNVGRIPDDQLEWLDGLLENNPRSPAMIFLHHMVVLDDDCTPEDGLENDDELMSVIEKHENVVCVNSGHKHQNRLATTKESGDTVFSTTAALIEYPIGYSIIRVYEKGYTQAFYKVLSEMEASEESRDWQRDDGLMLGTIEKRSFTKNFPELDNIAPVIDILELSRDEVFPAEEVHVTVSASDPDDEELTYHYTVEEGTIIGNGPSATWHVPTIPGTYTLTVRVSDGHGFSLPSSGHLKVLSQEDLVLEIIDVHMEPETLSKEGSYRLWVEIESRGVLDEIRVHAELQQLGGSDEQMLTSVSTISLEGRTRSIFSYEGEITSSIPKGEKIIHVSARAGGREIDSEIVVTVGDEEGGDDDAPGFSMVMSLMGLCTILIIKFRREKRRY